MRIEWWKIDRVRPYQNNPRHNNAGIDAVAASIQQFGWRQPIVVDETGTIIVGHVRWKAAKKLGLEKVPVHVAKGLTETQVRAYRLADNRTAALSSWNYDLLPIELKSLQGTDVDLNDLGFSTDELARLIEGFDSLEDEPQPDRPPEKLIRCPKCGHEFAWRQ